MNHRTLLLTALFAIGLAVAPTPVAAAEDPRFEADVPEPTVTPGETTQIAVEITNDAADIDDESRVCPARIGDLPRHHLPTP
ncbi:MAG: hypothetical protein ACOCP3_03280 [Halodesulfurarchaeum sp.]